MNVKSWRTTAAAVAGLLVLLGNAATALLDSDPATMPNWDAIFVMGAPLVGLLFARDNSVSSEDAGAK